MIDTTYWVRRVSRQAEVEDLAAKWNQLPQAQANPLLSHAWLAAASASLGRHSRPAFFTVGRDGRLVAGAPLVEVRRAGSRWLEIAGASVLGEPSGLLFDGEQSLDLLCDALSARRQPLALQRVEVNERLVQQLRRRHRGYVVVVPSAASLQVNLSQGWRLYLSTRSADCRSGFRRKRRRLEAMGPVDYESLRPEPDQVELVLGEAFDVEADGWKRRQGSAVLQRPQIHRFMVEAGKRFAAQGQLVAYFLRVGGVPVAMIIALEYGNRLWELKIGYRERFGNASPGRLLLWETLREACDRGLEGYEFLGSGDGQQRDWANAERFLQTLVFYPYSAAGALAFGADAAAHTVRRLRTALSGVHRTAAVTTAAEATEPAQR